MSRTRPVRPVRSAGIPGELLDLPRGAALSRLRARSLAGLDPACPLLWPGCDGLCREHPSARAAAELPTLPIGVFPVLARQSFVDGRLLRRMLSRSLSSWELSFLVREFAGRWYGLSQRKDDLAADEVFVLLAARPDLARADLLVLAALQPDPVSLLPLLEHSRYDRKVEGVLVRSLSLRPVSVAAEFVPFLSPAAHMALLLGRLDRTLSAGELAKEGRKALARFAHCPDVALETVGALAPEWSGSIGELVGACGVLLSNRGL